MVHIDTLQAQERLSTQELLTRIRAAIAAGETDFEIAASGQHDIGGPLWHPQGRKLTFRVRNAGQRLGSMCLENTEIVAEGSVSADVGWLNAGGRIVVKGDAGDTAGHCAAGGTIYIGGRAGTRSGSLMKHDPLYEAPQLWILKNVGSFCFEFMGGGRAVVCGYDSEAFESVLGDRACIGMVGGVVYFRGKASGYAADLAASALDADDVAYLDGNLDDFLQSIERTELRPLLTNWSEWRKLTPLRFEARGGETPPDMAAFRQREWVEGGIFSDVCTDDFAVKGLVARGLYRQRVPLWENAKYAAPCEFNCPAAIPTQRRFNLLREGKAEEAYRLVLAYTPFPASICGSVCPNLCMQACSRRALDEAIQISQLGRCSVDVEAPAPEKPTGKRIAVIGGGAAGLNAAWQLARKGHAVTVYDENETMGGKLELVVPREPLPQAILQKELRRIEQLGVRFVHPCEIDAVKFEQLRQVCDAVIVATGEVSTLDCLPGGKALRDGLPLAADHSALPGVFAAGDAVKPGRIVDAIAAGRAAAHAADLYVRGLEYQPENRRDRIPSDRLHKAYFEKCDRCQLPPASGDYSRCISCGTCRDCRMCVNSCPEGAIARVELPDGTYQYESDPEKCIGCGICAGICPCGIWAIRPNPEPIRMYKTYDRQ